MNILSKGLNSLELHSSNESRIAGTHTMNMVTIFFEVSFFGHTLSTQSKHTTRLAMIQLKMHFSTDRQCNPNKLAYSLNRYAGMARYKRKTNKIICTDLQS